MKMIRLLLITVAVFGLPGVLFAQDAPAPPPAPGPVAPRPGGPVYRPGVRPVYIGPTDSIASARVVRGKLSLIANPPKDKTPASAELFVDSKLIGAAPEKPYQVELDSATLQDGEHIFKAVAKDASGGEIWSASLKVMVTNAPVSGAQRPAVVGAPVPGGPVGPPTVGPPPSRPGAPAPGAAPVGEPPTGPVSLDQAYTNPTFGFTIRIPGAWKVKDQSTSMKPKLKGGFWFVFGTEPASKASMVVNLRHQKLDPGSDADTFARYNSYVMRWQRKTVNGSPAFATVVGTPAAKRVTHRMIIIKNGSAWMLNLIDTSGAPIELGSQAFEQITNSLETSPM